MKIDLRLCDKCNREFRGNAGRHVEIVTGRITDAAGDSDDTWIEADWCNECLARLTMEALTLVPLEKRATLGRKHGAK